MEQAQISPEDVLTSVVKTALQYRQENERLLSGESSYQRFVDTILSGQKILEIAKESQEDPTPTTEKSLQRFEQVMELLLHPDARKMMEYLATQLASDLNDPSGSHGFRNAALVPLGSAMSGMHIREIAATIDRNPYSFKRDIDMAIVFDATGYTKQLDAINLQEKIDQLMASPNDPDVPDYFTSCTWYNVTDSTVCQAVNADTDELYNLLSSCADDLPSDLMEHMRYYFHPSFPPHINERNRRVVLEVFSKLAQQPRIWEKVADKFLQAWKKNGVRLDEKYLGQAFYTDIDGIPLEMRREALQKLSEQLQNIQIQMVSQLLESTKSLAIAA